MSLFKEKRLICAITSGNSGAESIPQNQTDAEVINSDDLDYPIHSDEAAITDAGVHQDSAEQDNQSTLVAWNTPIKGIEKSLAEISGIDGLNRIYDLPIQAENPVEYLKKAKEKTKQQKFINENPEESKEKTPGQQLQDRLSNLFEIKDKKRAEQMAKAAENMNQNRARIMVEVFEKMDTKEREQLSVMLAKNAESLNQLSPQGFEHSLKLLSASSKKDRIKVVQEIAKNNDDLNILKSSWSPEADKIIGDFLRKVDGAYLADLSKRNGEEMKAKEPTIEDVRPMSEALRNKEAPQEVLLGGTMYLVTKLYETVKDYGEDLVEQQKILEEDKKIRKKVKDEIDEVLSRQSPDNVSLAKSQLVRHSFGRKNELDAAMLLLKQGEDMSEKNVRIAEQALYGAEKRGDIPSIVMWENAREQATDQVKKGSGLREQFQKQLKEYSYALEYLEGIEEKSNNPLVQELRKISNEYLDLFEDNDKKLFGKFDFGIVENVGAYTPAIIIENGQEGEVFLYRIFGDERVIPIDRALVDKVRRKLVEEQTSNKADA